MTLQNCVLVFLLSFEEVPLFCSSSHCSNDWLVGWLAIVPYIYLFIYFHHFVGFVFGLLFLFCLTPSHSRTRQPTSRRVSSILAYHIPTDRTSHIWIHRSHRTTGFVTSLFLFLFSLVLLVSTQQQWDEWWCVSGKMWFFFPENLSHVVGQEKDEFMYKTHNKECYISVPIFFTVCSKCMNFEM